jgi:hypothetical protein
MTPAFVSSLSFFTSSAVATSRFLSSVRDVSRDRRFVSTRQIPRKLSEIRRVSAGLGG